MCDLPPTYPTRNGNLNKAIVKLGQETNYMINSILSPTRRPYARARIQSNFIQCLFDTGADVSCINSKLLSKIGRGSAVNTVTTGKPLKAAGGQTLNVQGIQQIELEIDGKEVRHPFLVIDDLNESIILGIDFITKHGLNYSPATREFSWEGTKKWSQGFCTAIKREKIAALTTKVIKVSLITTGGKKPSSTEIISGCAASENKPLITGYPGLMAHNDGVALLKVVNCAPVDVEVSRDEVIGRIENLTEGQMELIDGHTIESIQRTPAAGRMDLKFIEENVNLNVPEKFKAQYMEVLRRFHDVISKDKSDLGRSKTLQHEISLKSKEPVYVKQFRIPEAHMKEVEQHLTEWLKLGVVEPCRSKYNSPLFLVTKKDGGLRVVQDFRALNDQTHEDKYSMHDVSECVAQIGRSGSTIFTTIDLTSGFWQMVLHPDSRPLTAFTIPGKGQHQWTVAPMGLLGSPASFQRLSRQLFTGYPTS